MAACMEGRETGTEPQVNFSISLIPCDVHSLVKETCSLDVKRTDSPSHMMQSDALSYQLTQSSSSLSLLFCLCSL